MEVRLATLADVESIAEIKVAHHPLKNRQSLFIKASLKELFLKEFRKRWITRLGQGFHVLLLRDRSQLLGLISYSFLQAGDAKIAELNNLYVSEPQRGKGLGRLLCKAALDKIREEKYRQARVWVLEDSHAIRRFYENLGFLATEELRIETVREGVFLKEVCYQLSLED
jgi:L-amino acid N-acyltransferase YncA